LAKLRVKNPKFAALTQEFIDLIKDELNVKEIEEVSALSEEKGWLLAVSGETQLGLKTDITPELKEEGWVRDLLRHIQEQRKVLGLKPGEKIWLGYAWPRGSRDLISANQNLFAREAFVEKAEAREACDLAGALTLDLDGQKVLLKAQKIA